MLGQVDKKIQRHLQPDLGYKNCTFTPNQGYESDPIKELKDRRRHDSATFGSIGSSSDGSMKENRADNNNTDHITTKNFNGK